MRLVSKKSVRFKSEDIKEKRKTGGKIIVKEKIESGTVFNLYTKLFRIILKEDNKLIFLKKKGEIFSYSRIHQIMSSLDKFYFYNSLLIESRIGHSI